MASSSRRSISSFNLSFLDIMFCGFGAVVLLVLIINTNIIDSRNEKVEDRRLELIQHQEIAAQLQKRKEALQQNYTVLQKQINSLTAKHNLLLEETTKTSPAILEPQTRKAEQEMTALQKELKALQSEKLLLEADKIKTQEIGDRVRQFEGEGNRQYLTGLKLGGKHVLILIDSSASMLGTRIVDIVRLKIRDAAKRRSAAKWQKAIATVEWIIANLSPDSSVQLFSFNTEVSPLSTDGQSSWTRITEFSTINKSIDTLKQISPGNGTSLERAFMKARSITPRPDNIILLTDGLPTQGRSSPSARTITGEKRIRLFEQAVKNLPPGIPINTILFPMEGDPMSPVLFWKLAIDSGGSFFTPTGDWP